MQKNEIGQLNCNAGNALDWKEFRWLGTKPKSVSSIKDFKFTLKFDGGKFSRENLIYVDQITGGTQEKFNERITRLVTQDNITDYVTEANNLLPKISSIVSGDFTRELEKGHRVHTWWDCDWKNKHCDWDELGVPNNSTGNKNCSDRSSKLPGTFLDWCEGRYGIFRVKIFTRRQLKGKACGKAGNNLEERCFLFAVYPELPPGLIYPSDKVDLTYKCNNASYTKLEMENIPGIDGVCFYSQKGPNIDEYELLGCSENPLEFIRYVDVNSAYRWKGQYYRIEDNCGTKIMGSSKLFAVSPLPEIVKPEIERAAKIGCAEVCDLEYSKNILNTNQGATREVQWFTSKLDHSEVPFHVGPIVPGCYTESKQFFVELVDKFPGCDEATTQSDRTQFDGIVLASIFTGLTNGERTPLESDYFEIKDTRDLTNSTVDCENREQYHVELPQIYDSGIDDLIANSNEQKVLKDLSGYHVARQNSPKLNWYKIDENGNEIPFSQTNEIYKITSDGRFVVCAQNTGIAQGDYISYVKYIARYEISVGIFDSDNNLVDNKSCSKIQGILEYKISLTDQDPSSCQANFNVIRSDLESNGTLDDCDLSEFFIDCPEDARNPEIGLDDFGTISLFNQTHPKLIEIPYTSSTKVLHEWSETDGLKTPLNTKSETDYPNIPVSENDYQIYQLDMEQTFKYVEDLPGQPVQTQSFTVDIKYCAVVYKCSNCKN